MAILTEAVHALRRMAEEPEEADALSLAEFALSDFRDLVADWTESGNEVQASIGCYPGWKTAGK
jgi:hypothetical protein